MSNNAMCKIPRKRKICCIVYHDKYFQTMEDLVDFLGDGEGGLKFSPVTIERIISCIPQIDAPTMEATLVALKVPKTKIKKLLTGELITPAAPRKRKTDTKTKK